MFTGIIEQQGSIIDINAGVFIIENPFSETLTLGQSIAHDGACMTLVEIGKERRKTGKSFYSFFAMEESFSKTNFGSKNIGNSFNLERAMIYGQRVDGHMVSGHIDTTALITDISKNPDDSWNFSIALDAQRASNVIEKGSIAINGVSLTVTNIKNQGINNVTVTVCLIPYTREHTNLSRLSVGDNVNIEFDMMGKYVLQNNNTYGARN